MKYVILWFYLGGRIEIGSGKLPKAVCRRELAALTEMFREQGRRDIERGYCMAVAE